MDDDRPHPADDPMLADVWKDMSPTQRLEFMVHEDESVPDEVTERVQRMFEERFPKP